MRVRDYQISIAVLGFASLLTGCDSKGQPAPPESAGLASSNVIVAEDKSLPLEEYIKRGVPAPDRPWSPQNYVEAAQALQKIAQENVLQLPRVHSAASGGLLSRISHRENLEMFRSSSLPLETRMSHVGDLMQGLKGLMMVYVEATNRGKSFDAELVEVMILSIRINRLMYDLVKDTRIADDDPKREARLQGLRQMQSGFATSVNGFIETLSERRIYRLPELVRLVQAAKDDMSPVFGILTELSQKEFRYKISDLATKESNHDLRAALQELSTSLNPPK